MALRLLQATSFLWAGGILAIALEARVKFNAPSVKREIGLDVGRHVFGAFNKAEIGLSATLLGELLIGWPIAEVRWLICSVLTILAVQTVWLLPTLQDQARTVIEGETVPDAEYAHVGYIFLEVAKLSSLIFIGWTVVPS